MRTLTPEDEKVGVTLSRKGDTGASVSLQAEKSRDILFFWKFVIHFRETVFRVSFTTVALVLQKNVI